MKRYIRCSAVLDDRLREKTRSELVEGLVEQYKKENLNVNV